MKYYHDLYLSKSLISKKDEIIKKLENSQWQLSKFLLVLAQNEKNHLEFFDSVLLTQNLMPKEDLFVIGIADSYVGAVDMVQQITEEVYTNTGSTDIRGYLLSKESNA